MVCLKRTLPCYWTYRVQALPRHNLVFKVESRASGHEIDRHLLSFPCVVCVVWTSGKAPASPAGLTKQCACGRGVGGGGGERSKVWEPKVLFYSDTLWPPASQNQTCRSLPFAEEKQWVCSPVEWTIQRWEPVIYHTVQMKNATCCPRIPSVKWEPGFCWKWIVAL